MESARDRARYTSKVPHSQPPNRIALRSEDYTTSTGITGITLDRAG